MTGTASQQGSRVSGDPYVLGDVGGVLADIVDGLHDVKRQLDGLPYALVGGVAVLVYVQGHRITEDIDSAVRALRYDIHERLRIVANPAGTGRRDSFVLTNGVPVDILMAGLNPPRQGLGARREAKAHAARWAIETAVDLMLAVEPPGSRGPLTIPVATPAALVAMKAVSSSDATRGDKQATDLLDIWRLLSDNPVRTAELLDALTTAPSRLLGYTRVRLEHLCSTKPGDFIRAMAAGPGRASSVAEVRQLYDDMIAPTLRN